MEGVPGFNFLQFLHISEDPTWSLYAFILVKKKQQCLYFQKKTTETSPVLQDIIPLCILNNHISVWYITLQSPYI